MGKKILKRYCIHYSNTNLNVLYNKKKSNDDKNNFIYIIVFLFQIKILLQNMLKLLKIPGFSIIF